MCTSLLGKWPPGIYKDLFIDLAEVSTRQQNFHRLKMWLLYPCNGPSSPKQWPRQGTPHSMVWAWSGSRRKCSAIFQHLFLQTPMRTWSPTLCIWCSRCTTAVKAGSQLKWECGGHQKGQHTFCSLTHICQKWTFWHLAFSVLYIQYV